MLKSVGKLLIVLGLASLLSMGLFEAGAARRTSTFLGKGGWIRSAWVDLGNNAAYLTTSSWFSLPEIEGVSFELGCDVYMDLMVRPIPISNVTGRINVLKVKVYEVRVYLINKSGASASGIAWGSLLASTLPEELKVLDKYSEAVMELEEGPSYRPSYFRFYEGKIPLKNSKEERMALFIMFSNASPGSMEPGVDFSILMTISPGTQQYARGIYLVIAGISIIALHYLRHPEEAKELPKRIKRRFPLPSGKSTIGESLR